MNQYYKLQEDYKKLSDEYDTLKTRHDKLVEALRKINNWSKAYPLEIFTKPDLKKAHKVLEEAGMTLDAITADAMRHVLNGIKDIVEQAFREAGEL